MRAFLKFRQMVPTHDLLAWKLLELESKHDAQFRAVFEAIRRLMDLRAKLVKTIGVKPKQVR
jgi:hypothetical protein